MSKQPPHILVTTPESLYILLGSESGRGMLGTATTVIVDEIHAVAASKRGSHLALSLERLDAVCQRRLLRIGLSATQKPIEAVARFLVGAGTSIADVRPAPSPPGERDGVRGAGLPETSSEPESASHHATSTRPLTFPKRGLTPGAILSPREEEAETRAIQTVATDFSPSPRGERACPRLDRGAGVRGTGLPETSGPQTSASHIPASTHPLTSVLSPRGEEANVRSDVAVIDVGHQRPRDLGLSVPPVPLEAVMSNDAWELVYNQLAAVVQAHRTTLVFVNTRRMAERVTRHLSERLGKQHVAAHHGSLAKEQRLDAEQRLKRGELSALVATASLELGIDIGDVDLVCQIGSPRSIAAFLQRAGRSGHAVIGTPKARLFPTTRDELVECAALLDCVRRGD